MYESRGKIRGFLTNSPIYSWVVLAVLMLYGRWHVNRFLDSRALTRESLASDLQKEGMPEMQIFAIVHAVDQATQTTFAATINLFYIMVMVVVFTIEFQRRREKANAKTTTPDKTGPPPTELVGDCCSQG